ncbi:MAG: hypothetical protein SFW36_23760 [Leptolyngbyaceae cyanobacterium bins.59]|nr:hypothetical protein [Leptolyngbyaceae cyanobacterium bins.59]
MKSLCTNQDDGLIILMEEVFREIDYEEATDARAARDRRLEELTAQGFSCACENLSTVYGQRVYLVRVDEPDRGERNTRRIDSSDGRERQERSRAEPRLKLKSGSLPSYEER